MPNPDNRNIDTPENDGKGTIVLQIYISPDDLNELRDALINGSMTYPSTVADKFIETFGAVLEHAENTINELDSQFYDELMSRIGPKSIN